MLTLYGDALAPRGSTPVALAAWLELAHTLGLSARHARTSVQRLTQADWLQAHREGRCSFYTGSDAGVRRTVLGEQRIYAPQVKVGGEPARWNFLVLGAQLRASIRRNLAQELVWCGFGEVAPGVFAHHGAELAVDVRELLAAHGACEHVWSLLGANPGQDPALPDTAVLCPRDHCVQRMRRGWQRFVDRYGSTDGNPPAREPSQAFVLRIRLVHDYRRLLQSHPELPCAAGVDMQATRLLAQRIFAGLYLSLLDSSERYLDQFLPPPDRKGTALLLHRVRRLHSAWGS